jgi:hypothetical protein
MLERPVLERRLKEFVHHAQSPPGGVSQQ